MSSVVVDIDGVLADSEQIMYYCFENYFDKKCAVGAKNWEEGFGVTTEEVNHVWKIYSKQIYRECLPISGAIRAIEDLHKVFDINLVTARHISDKKYTKQWLKQYAVKYDSLHFVGKGSNKIKLDVVKNCDYFIDDNIANVIEVANLGKKCYLFRKDEPTMFTPGNVIRVKKWSEIVLDILRTGEIS